MQKAHHILKTHPAMYRAASLGTKTFEVRKDDRAFQCGDRVSLKYHDPADDLPQPQFRPPRPEDNLPTLDFEIGFVLRGGQYGVEPGHVAFSLIPVLTDELP